MTDFTPLLDALRQFKSSGDDGCLPAGRGALSVVAIRPKTIMLYAPKSESISISVWPGALT